MIHLGKWDGMGGVPECDGNPPDDDLTPEAVRDAFEVGELWERFAEFVRCGVGMFDICERLSGLRGNADVRVRPAYVGRDRWSIRRDIRLSGTSHYISQNVRVEDADIGACFADDEALVDQFLAEECERRIETRKEAD